MREFLRFDYGHVGSKRLPVHITSILYQHLLLLLQAWLFTRRKNWNLGGPGTCPLHTHPLTPKRKTNKKTNILKSTSLFGVAEQSIIFKNCFFTVSSVPASFHVPHRLDQSGQFTDVHSHSLAQRQLSNFPPWLNTTPAANIVNLSLSNPPPPPPAKTWRRSV